MYTIEQEIQELQRELKMRLKTYPRFIDSKKMTRIEADARVDMLRSVIARLDALRTQSMDQAAPEQPPQPADQPPAEQPPADQSTNPDPAP